MAGTNELVDLDASHFTTDPNEYINASVVNRTNLRLLNNIKILNDALNAITDSDTLLSFSDLFQATPSVSELAEANTRIDTAFDRINLLRFAICGGYASGANSCVHYLPGSFNEVGDDFSAKLPNISNEVYSEATALKYHGKAVTIVKMRKGMAYVYTEDPNAKINGVDATSTYLYSAPTTEELYDVVTLRCYCEFDGSTVQVNWVVDSGMGAWQVIDGSAVMDIEVGVVETADISLECVSGDINELMSAAQDEINTVDLAPFKEEVQQPTHGFNVMDVVSFNGTEYIYAKADDISKTTAVGIIESVTPDAFVIVFGGILVRVPGTFTSGKDYYLDTVANGTAVQYKPADVLNNVELKLGTALNDSELLVNIGTPFVYDEEYIDHLTAVRIKPGSIMMWPNDAPPDGWLVRNGGLYATEDYPNLFAVIGYTYGGADAFFNIPDDLGLFERCADTVGTIDQDDRFSADGLGTLVADPLDYVGSLQASGVEAHTHYTNTIHRASDDGQTYIDDGAIVHTVGGTQPYIGLSSVLSDDLIIVNSTSTGGHDTHPINRAYLPIIKY
jgi:microcystin-dependent protein